MSPWCFRARAPTSSSAGTGIYREPLSLAPLTRLPDPMRRGLRAVSKAIPTGHARQELPGAGHHPDRGALQRQRPDLHRGRRDPPAARARRRAAARYTDITAPLYAEAAADGLDDVTKMQYVDMTPGCAATSWSRPTGCPWRTRWSCGCRSSTGRCGRWPRSCRRRSRCRRARNATKYAMRQAVAQVVPPAIVNRPKLGFPMPTRVWLAGEMYEWARDILHTSGADDLLDLSYVEGLLQRAQGRGAPTTPARSGRCWSSACGTPSSSPARWTRASAATSPLC